MSVEATESIPQLTSNTGVFANPPARDILNCKDSCLDLQHTEKLDQGARIKNYSHRLLGAASVGQECNTFRKGIAQARTGSHIDCLVGTKSRRRFLSLSSIVWPLLELDSVGYSTVFCVHVDQSGPRLARQVVYCLLARGRSQAPGILRCKGVCSQCFEVLPSKVTCSAGLETAGRRRLQLDHTDLS